MAKFCLVLDLDQTLVYFTGSKITIRPYVKNLFHFLFENREKICFGFFSGGSEPYVKAVVETLPIKNPPLFVFSKDMCKFDYDRKMTKDLNHVWDNYDTHPSRTLLVDDLSVEFAGQEKNVLRIPCWRGDPNDIRIAALLDVIEWILPLFSEIPIRDFDVRDYNLSLEPEEAIDEYILENVIDFDDYVEMPPSS
jgi:hypothetical protein